MDGNKKAPLIDTICGVGVDLPVPVPVLLLLLPEEVLIEILLWLPVISLLRFKSVCKSWRDLIQSPYFIHLHTTTTFNFSSSSNSSKQQQQQQLVGGGETFILQSSPFEFDVCAYWERKTKMFILSIGGGPGGGGGGGGGEDDDDDDDQVVFKLDDLEFPPYYKDFPSTQILMVGSCNGLICLHDSKLRDVSLWNPATRQFRILPKSITIQEEEGINFIYDFVALGFDVKTKDYKVLQVSCFGPTTTYIEQQWRRRPECICRVQVYSLSTDSWRLLKGINSLPAKPVHVPIQSQLGLYRNGSYFFVGKKFPPSIQNLNNDQEEIRNNNNNNNSLMISFDFTKEIFTTMQFPDHDDRYRLLITTHLGDKIALFTTRINSSLFGLEGDDDESRSDDYYDDYENYDIWVLNEQGGDDDDDVNKESSWAKLHSFPIKGRLAWECILPRGILNNGKFGLIETRTQYNGDVFSELRLLNLVTKEPIQNFPICDWELRNRALRICVYKYSLVSIIGGNETRLRGWLVMQCAPFNKVTRGIENHIFMKEDGEESIGSKAG